MEEHLPEETLRLRCQEAIRLIRLSWRHRDFGIGRRNPQFVDAADLVADEAAQLRGARAVVAIAIVRLRGSDAEEQHDRRSENSPHAKKTLRETIEAVRFGSTHRVGWMSLHLGNHGDISSSSWG